MNNADMPIAFVDVDDAEFVRQCRPVRGLTKREYFAGLAMQGLLAGADQVEGFNYCVIADDAVRSADALLAELGKEKSQ